MGVIEAKGMAYKSQFLCERTRSEEVMIEKASRMTLLTTKDTAKFCTKRGIEEGSFLNLLKSKFIRTLKVFGKKSQVSVLEHLLKSLIAEESDIC